MQWPINGAVANNRSDPIDFAIFAFDFCFIAFVCAVDEQRPIHGIEGVSARVGF